MLIYEKKSIFRFTFSVISYQPYFSYSAFFIFLILFHITLYSSRIKKEKHHDLNATVFPFPYYIIITLFPYCFISLHTSPIPSNAPLPLPGRPWKRSIPGCSASGGAAPGHARRLVWRGQRRYPQVFLPYLPAW